MSKILALDVGEKTIGIALSDASQTWAFAGETLWRQDKKQDMARLRELIAANDVCKIVVGLPLLPDDTPGIQAQKVLAFIRDLRGSVRIPIVTEDERLTTWDAEQAMIANGKRRSERKRTLDSVAASLILQAYLERKRLAARPTVIDRQMEPDDRAVNNVADEDADVNGTTGVSE